MRWVDQRMVACDGGGGPLGHPKIFINVDKPQINMCTYCGLPYVSDTIIHITKTDANRPIHITRNTCNRYRRNSLAILLRLLAMQQRFHYHLRQLWRARFRASSQDLLKNSMLRPSLISHLAIGKICNWFICFEAWVPLHVHMRLNCIHVISCQHRS